MNTGSNDKIFERWLASGYGSSGDIERNVDVWSFVRGGTGPDGAPVAPLKKQPAKSIDPGAMPRSPGGASQQRSKDRSMSISSTGGSSAHASSSANSPRMPASAAPNSALSALNLSSTSAGAAADSSDAVSGSDTGESRKRSAVAVKADAQKSLPSPQAARPPTAPSSADKESKETKDSGDAACTCGAVHSDALHHHHHHAIQPSGGSGSGSGSGGGSGGSVAGHTAMDPRAAARTLLDLLDGTPFPFAMPASVGSASTGDSFPSLSSLLLSVSGGCSCEGCKSVLSEYSSQLDTLYSSLAEGGAGGNGGLAAGHLGTESCCATCAKLKGAFLP